MLWRPGLGRHCHPHNTLPRLGEVPSPFWLSEFLSGKESLGPEMGVMMVPKSKHMQMQKPAWLIKIHKRLNLIYNQRTSNKINTVKFHISLTRLVHCKNLQRSQVWVEAPWSREPGISFCWGCLFAQLVKKPLWRCDLTMQISYDPAVSLQIVHKKSFPKITPHSKILVVISDVYWY